MSGLLTVTAQIAQIIGVGLDLTSLLLGKMDSPVRDWFVQEIKNGTYSKSGPHVGAIWITVVEGSHLTTSGYVLSAYYHPTQRHSATVTGKVGPIKTFEGPGVWAVAHCTKAMSGNKAQYNTAGTPGWVDG